MKKFLERYPDAVKLHRDSGILHFECKLVRVDRSRKPKIIRVIMSDKERAEYRQRFLDNLEKPPKLFGKTGIRRGR